MPKRAAKKAEALPVTECAGLIAFELTYTDDPKNTWDPSPSKEKKPVQMTAAEAVEACGEEDNVIHHIRVFCPLDRKDKERHVVPGRNYGGCVVRKTAKTGYQSQGRDTHVSTVAEGIHKAVRMVLR